MKSLTLAMAALVACPSCLPVLFVPILWPSNGDDVDDFDDFDDDLSAPPNVELVGLPVDRPIGPNDELVVSFEDDSIGSVVTLTFGREDAARVVTSTASGEVSVRGADLRDGMGLLVLSIEDLDGQTATVTYDNVLVDSVAPDAEITDTVVNGLGEGEKGAFSAWVSDEWALASVSLIIDDVAVATDDFDGFPSTVGTDYDYSYFAVDGAALSPGRHDASLIVIDLAGNSSEQSFELVVDVEAPQVQVSVDADDNGGVVVAVSATDNIGMGRVVITANDAPLGELLGAGTMRIDSRDLAAGPIDIGATAYDLVGIAASAVPVRVVVP